MKLRDKLKISFCVMIVLPVIMLCVFVVGIFKIQTAYARHIMLKVIRCYYIFIRL
jgi:hypothetical protein